MQTKVIQEKIIKLYTQFKDGKIPTPAQHEVNPGLEKSSCLNFVYFTLPVSLNFQRSSPAMWQAARKTFNEHFDNDPRVFFQEADYDVKNILELFSSKYKNSFPFLRGLKLSNYWIYILTHYTDAKFKNLHLLSIIPDTHVIQSTVKLGLRDDRITPVEVVKVWYEIMEGMDINPIDMHPVLWNWSRNGFNPEV